MFGKAAQQHALDRDLHAMNRAPPKKLLAVHWGPLTEKPVNPKNIQCPLKSCLACARPGPCLVSKVFCPAPLGVDHFVFAATVPRSFSGCGFAVTAWKILVFLPATLNEIRFTISHSGDGGLPRKINESPCRGTSKTSVPFDFRVRPNGNELPHKSRGKAVCVGSPPPHHHRIVEGNQ